MPVPPMQRIAVRAIVDAPPPDAAGSACLLDRRRRRLVVGAAHHKWEGSVADA
jgi:hypothetical protein